MLPSYVSIIFEHLKQLQGSQCSASSYPKAHQLSSKRVTCKKFLNSLSLGSRINSSFASWNRITVFRWCHFRISYREICWFKLGMGMPQTFHVDVYREGRELDMEGLFPRSTVSCAELHGRTGLRQSNQPPSRTAEYGSH